MEAQRASEGVILFGTNEPDEKGRVLTAGTLSVEFDKGYPGYVRRGDRELTRAVAFVTAGAS
jgi:D-apionolactonase